MESLQQVFSNEAGTLKMLAIVSEVAIANRKQLANEKPPSIVRNLACQP